MIYRFDRFRVDDVEFRLCAEDQPVALEPKALRVLLYLVENRNRLVRKGELLDQVWQDANVAESTLTRSIGLLRKALDDDSRNPRYIETVPTAGYRFIGQVAVSDGKAVSVPAIETLAPGVAAATAANPNPSPKSRKRAGQIALLSGCVALLVVAAGWMIQRQMHAASRIRSLAVLPLDNLSGDPGQEYFADGMTDELITQLARIPNLRVVSRTSTMQEKGARKPLQQIAQELNVDAIVEGSVVRAGDKVRITAQLIDPRDDSHLWAQSFEGSMSDLLSLQDDVATMVAHAARLAIAPSAASRQKVGPAAQDAYLRGRYFINKQDPGYAAEAFERAIALEPAYASAYAGLADALDMGSAFGLGKPTELMPRARAAAERAIQLDPESGEAYTALGSVQTIWDWNFAEAERNLLRGIALSPDYSLAEMKYAALLDATGRPAEAVAHMQRALELDPLSFYLTRRLGATLYLARRYDEALAALRTAQEMDASAPGIEDYLTLIYQEQGKHDEAVAHDLIAHKQWPATDTARLQSIYQRQGWLPYFQARRSVLLSQPPHDCNALDVAANDVTLGDLDRAFQEMNKAVDQHCYRVVWARVDPLLDPLWSDPRAPRLLSRIYPGGSAVK